MFDRLAAHAMRHARGLTHDSGREEDDLRGALIVPFDFGDREAEELVGRVDRFNKEQLRRSLAIEIPELRKASTKRLAKQTVTRARGITEHMAKRLAPIMAEAAAGGLRGSELTAELQSKLKLERKFARNLAVGQVIQINAAATRERHSKLGITHYKWRAVPDGYTRRWHKELDGKIFSYAEPPLGGGGGPKDHGHPGTADKCRCQAIPVIPEAAPVANDAFRTGQLDVSGKDVFTLSKTTPDTLRGGSLAYLRSGGTARAQAPIAFDVYPDTGLRLSDGRHRITVAREQGVKTVTAELREHTSSGKIIRQRKVRVKI